ncbi:hypothetical protein Esti_002722 [Eimeria stiedai]
MARTAEESGGLLADGLHKSSPDEHVGSRPTNIQIYLRMRPMAGRCAWHTVVGENGRTFVTRIPRDAGSGTHNARNEYKFYFDDIFGQDATQEDVFRGVALPVVDDALRGVNGTIFAYGQTGTGKTYTITGDSEAFEMRGIIPRAIARVFEAAASCSSAEFTLAISYLEIYQDRGYDLLVKSDTRGNRLEDLQRVSAVTDHRGQIVLRGLSIHRVRTEEEALNLLFVGDANRIVAETPLSDCSTRSHCIFTIWIASKEYGSHTTRRAKLHLVDLAGSERVKQSGTRPGDCAFQEACSINLTLHYLEQVILALHQKAAGQLTHVPYRNSLMTSVLKDSLGGNCRTRMIATIALELYAIQETINTCKFAQTVAKITNVVGVNEEEVAEVLIERLQKENEELREQLQLSAAMQDGCDVLTEEGKAACRNSIEQFLKASDDVLDLPVAAVKDLRSADYCFRLMREKFRDVESRNSGSPCRRQDCRESLQKLQLHIKQRDAEIATLLGILHQASEPPEGSQATNPIASVTRAAVEAAVKGPQHYSLFGSLPWLTGPEATALLRDRGRAFEILRRSARKVELLEADSQRLNSHYHDAKRHRGAAAKARSKLSEAKAELEKLRVRKCLRGNSETGLGDASLEETALLQQVAEWRDEYIKNVELLEADKRELKRLHFSVQRGRKKLQDDFERWFNVVAARQAQCLGEDTLIGNPPVAEAYKMHLLKHDWPTPLRVQNSGRNAAKVGVDKANSAQPANPRLAHRGTYPWLGENLAGRELAQQQLPANYSLSPLDRRQGKECPSEEVNGPSSPHFLAVTHPEVLHINTHENKSQKRLKEKDAFPLLPWPDGDLYDRRKPSVGTTVGEIDNSENLLGHIEDHISGKLYTGNPSADIDIEAFYEALDSDPISEEGDGSGDNCLPETKSWDIASVIRRAGIAPAEVNK